MELLLPMLGAPGSSLSRARLSRLGTFAVFVSPAKQMAVVVGLPEIRTRHFPSMFCITNHPTPGLHIITGIDTVK